MKFVFIQFYKRSYCIATTLVVSSILFTLELKAQVNRIDESWTSPSSYYELRATASGRPFIVTQDASFKTQLLLLNEAGKIQSITNLGMNDSTILINYQLIDNGEDYLMLAQFQSTRFYQVAFAHINKRGVYSSPFRVVDSSRSDLPRAGGPFLLLSSEDGKFVAWTKLNRSIEKYKLLWDYKIINSSAEFQARKTMFIAFDPSLQFHTPPYLAGNTIHLVVSDLPGIDSKLGSTVYLYTGEGTDSILRREIYFKAAKPLQFSFASHPGTARVHIFGLYEDFYQKQIGGLLMIELRGRQIRQHRHEFSDEFSSKLRSGVLGVRARKSLNNLVIHSASIDSTGRSNVVLYAKLNRFLVRNKPMFTKEKSFTPDIPSSAPPQQQVPQQDLSKIHEALVKGDSMINDLPTPVERWRLTNRANWSYKETHVVMTFDRTFKLLANDHFENFIRTDNAAGPSFSFLDDKNFVLFSIEPRAPAPGTMKVTFLDLNKRIAESSNMSLEKNPFYRYAVLQIAKRKFLTFTFNESRFGITELNFNPR